MFVKEMCIICIHVFRCLKNVCDQKLSVFYPLGVNKENGWCRGPNLTSFFWPYKVFNKMKNISWHCVCSQLQL